MRIVNRKSFSKRMVVSISLLLLFIILPISGKMIPISEDNVNMSKAWSIVHNVAGTLFFVIGMFHISYNWKIIKNYLKQK